MAKSKLYPVISLRDSRMESNNLFSSDMGSLQSGNTTNSVALNGLFDTSVNKTEVFFSVSVTGTGTPGDIYIAGKGFIGGLAPTASIDGAVWLSPCELIVNGELSKTVET